VTLAHCRVRPRMSAAISLLRGGPRRAPAHRGRSRDTCAARPTRARAPVRAGCCCQPRSSTPHTYPRPSFRTRPIWVSFVLALDAGDPHLAPCRVRANGTLRPRVPLPPAGSTADQERRSAPLRDFGQWPGVAGCPASWLLALASSRTAVSNIAGSAWSAAVPGVGKTQPSRLAIAFGRVDIGRAWRASSGTEARQCWTDRVAAHGCAAPRRPLRPQDRKRRRASKRAGAARTAPRTAPDPQAGTRPSPCATSPRTTAAQPCWTHARRETDRGAPASAGCLRFAFMARARASIPRAAVLWRAGRRSGGDAGASAA
jgi:hypothetical protein